MSTSPGPGELPPDFETRLPDDIEVRHCYRHPDRETGVSCSNCGRPICHECMIPAPVGFRCPECVKEQNAHGSRAKVVTRGQIRSRWGAGGVGTGAPVTRALIIANVAYFVVELVYGFARGMPVSSMLFRGVPDFVVNQLGALTPALVHDGQYWRLIAAMFLHGSLIHILFNMYALYIGGSFLERLAGRGKYLAIYLIAGLAGNVLVYALSPVLTPTVGASTAIFGVFGALFMYSIHFRDTAAGQALRSMGMVILINLVFTFAFRGVSWQGHIGGLIGGVLAVEALTEFGRRDLRRPFGGLDIALLVGIVVVLALIVLWRTATFPLA